jgi:hypothetical protein
MFYVKMFEHTGQMARVDGDADAETNIFGWDHAVGEIFETADRTCKIVDVIDCIHTDDIRGNYILATVQQLED